MSDSNTKLNNDIIQVILYNIHNRTFQNHKPSFKLLNKILLNKYLNSLSEQRFLKCYLEVSDEDQVICLLDGFDVLTSQHIMNSKLKAKLDWPSYLINKAFYMGNLTIAFNFVNSGFKIYNYNKDTLAISLAKEVNINNTDDIFLLKSKKVLLSGLSGELTVMVRDTFDVLCNSNIVDSRIWKFLETTKQRFIAVHLDRKARLWCIKSLNLIQVITDFGISNLTYIPYLVGLRDGSICAGVEHIVDIDREFINITYGVWDIDNTSEFKLLHSDSVYSKYKICETYNSLILARRINVYNSCTNIERVYIYNSRDYMLVNMLEMTQTMCDIFTLGYGFTLIQYDKSISLQKSEKVIDELEMEVVIIEVNSVKKIVIAKTKDKSLIFKLN
jgi:hypothetical protein